MATNSNGYIAAAYGQVDVVESGFVEQFHEACRNCGKSLILVNEGLMDYVERKLRYYHRNKGFLLIGYLKDVTLKFTHIQKTKKEEEIRWDFDCGSSLLLAPWERDGSYVFVIYQDGKLPVAIVRYAYPGEHIIECAASWQSRTRGHPPDENYKLRELLNPIMHIPMVNSFRPPKRRYEKLDVKEVVYI